MTTTSPQILLVEDSLSLARVYVQYLTQEALEVTHVETGTEAMALLRAAPPQLLLLDLKLPDMDGMEILRHIQENHVPTAVVVITAHGSVNVAVDAMRAGAADFLIKPFNAERLVFTARNALERQRLTHLVETYEESIAKQQSSSFVGSSLSMHAVYRIIESAAPSSATVFITGESGTGKELAADAIHRQSERREEPFVAINCAAIPRDLIESEIFGHVKGAFTGAIDDHEGAASRADGGTLFLDEICEMDPSLQSKLLRFIQSGTFQKVGGTLLQRVDVRFVCATNQDPLVAVAEGRFREDLYYRLHVIPLEMPPLRDRGDDVLEIARHVLLRHSQNEGKRFVGFAPEAEARLRAYSWPGNVRQLENVLHNTVVLNDGDYVTLDMLPIPLNRGIAGEDAHPRHDDTPVVPIETRSLAPGVRPLWQIEKEAIERAIAACEGNIPRAAALLQVSPSTVYRKRQAWAEQEEAGLGS